MKIHILEQPKSTCKEAAFSSPVQRNLFLKKSIQATFICSAALLSATVQADITGTVFRDYNANGSQDLLEPGIAGISAQATDTQGNSITVTTDADGRYSVSGLAGDQARIEFILPTDGSLNFLQPGANGRSSVEFVSTNSNAVNVGFNNPSQFCQANPELVTACYTSGPQTTNADVLVGFPYSAGNDGSSPLDSSYDLPAHGVKATASQIGSTYGLAWQRSSSTLFAAAFLKRFAGFGPAGTGAIYKVDSNGAPMLFLQLGAAGNNPHQAGTDWASDNNSSSLVGKVSLGDLDISDDEKTLYTIDLSTRELIEIPVGVPAIAPAAGAIKRIATPRPANCAADDVRPFALKFHDGQLYVGLTCTAESTVDAATAPTGDASQLRAYVYTYTPGTGFSASSAFEFPLNYSRECADVGTFSDCKDWAPAEWNPWIPGAWPIQFPEKSQVLFPSYPQPWLTDIEFDNGDMILGFRDRFGDQIGNQVKANPSDETLISGLSAGDVLRACQIGNGWELEQNGSCGGVTTTPEYSNNLAGSGPGTPGREYYWDEYLIAHPLDPLPGQPWHSELSSGGLLQLPGKADVAFTAFDPVPLAGSNVDGGVLWLNNTTGKRTHSYRIYDGVLDSADPGFGKANGLGDLEALCSPAPVEVGNFIWEDSNNNGLQDAGEKPLAGVSVVLACAPDQATAITDANGNYLFSNALGGNAPFMTAGKSCTITALTTQGELKLTDANTGNDTLDSDASATGVINFIAGAPGENNHTFDIGYASEAQEPPVVEPPVVEPPVIEPPVVEPPVVEPPVVNPPIDPAQPSTTSAVGIPSVSAWGLIMLSGLLGIAGLFRRRQ